MGACNFWTMKDFDLWVIDDEKVCQWYLGEEFIAEREKEFDDYDYLWDVELAYDLFKEDFDREAGLDELNSSLMWYKVELKAGYYDGVQIYVDTEWLDIDEVATWLPSKPLVWDDEECELQFGLTKEETRKMIEEEKKKINDFLENLKWFGFYKINCIGVFNNGEAIYEKA